MKAERADRREFTGYLTNRVVGSVADAGQAEAAIAALLQAGFDREDVDMLHGEQDLQRLDPAGIGRGFLAQFQRRLTQTLELEEFKHLAHHVEDIRAGRYVITVRTRRRGLRTAAADILHQHGAEFVGFHGRWSCEELPATPQTSPDAIPGLFARAWNERNPDHLAALFDEDAEFVHGSGVCWHDRESIRKAHAESPGGGFAASTLTTGETRVKLLSPEVAVVHTRLTRSGEAPAGAAGHDQPHASIVSFVVHRAGDRWLCASAQHTDVAAAPAPSVLDAPGMFGVAGYPGDPVS